MSDKILFVGDEPGVQEDVRTAAGMLLVAKGTQINYALLARLRNFLRRSTISGTVLVHVPH